MKAILVAGFSADVADRLRRLEGVRVESVLRLDVVPLRMAEAQYSLLILSALDEPTELIPVFRQVLAVDESTRPPVILCLPQNLNTGAIAGLIEQQAFDHVMFHPIKCEELVDRVARVLGMRVFPNAPEQTAQERAAEAMAILLKRFRAAVDEQGEIIERAVAASMSDGLSPEVQADAAEAAGRLADSTQTFGLLEASRMARDIEQILRVPREPAPGQTQLLCLLVVVLRAELQAVANIASRSISAT